MDLRRGILQIAGQKIDAKNLGEREGSAYFYETCAIDFEYVAVREVSRDRLRSEQPLCSLCLCCLWKPSFNNHRGTENSGLHRENSMKIIVSIFITFASVLTALAQQAQLDMLRRGL
jgi:hypothetical protein